MGLESRRGNSGHYQANANSGLESLAAEASRRVEKLKHAEHGEQDAGNTQDDGTRSPSRSSGQRGKVRKAYTITKQRERWTEEEHDRFLQALKRYGRAWRKIEEHIGSKTAVQIRSHAQKFFSKLQREQSMNGGRDESSKNDINIPPPRPKRKPMHPYPRNSVENSSDARGGEPVRNEVRDSRPQEGQRGKMADGCANKSTDNTTSTRSTHLRNNNAQYSTSSGYQTSQPMTNHPQLLQAQPTPFSGSVLAAQPSHVQLPPFPSLDISGGDNMTKVLKDAAMAAASAWNQVIAGASQKIQYQIQAQSMQPPSLQTAPSVWSMPFTSMGSEPVEGNPFMRQILSQLGTQQSAPISMLSNMTAPGMPVRAFQPSFSMSPPTKVMDHHATAFAHPQSQRSKAHQEMTEKDGHTSDRDSRGSEQDRPRESRKSAFKHSSQSGMSYWSGKRPYSAVEAELGRSAWEMMNRVMSQSGTEAPAEEARPANHMQAPSTGGNATARRLMKPIPHSAKISPLHEQNSQANLHSEPCSNTSQLASFFQRAAAAENRRDSQSLGNGTSGNGDNGSFGEDENRFVAQSQKSKLDKGSNNGSGSDDGNGKVIKDKGSQDIALKDSQNTMSAASGKKDSNDDLVSAANKLVKSNLPGSDKASNNGSGSSDEDANANGSDGTGTNEEKGSREGSNSGQASPREQSPVKDVRSAEASRQEVKRSKPFAHSSQHPNSAEAVWANSATLQNQQQAFQDAQQLNRPTQAELVQQILPFKLTPQQQQAISTWAAANSQSQPHQYELMQSLLNGMAVNNNEFTSAKASPGMHRQISGLTSADTGSNTECHAANFLAGRTSGQDVQKAGDLPSRPSGFQPYLKRAAESSLAGPPAKRLAGAPLTPDHGEGRLQDLPQAQNLKQLASKQPSVTPFGAHAVQRRAHS